MTVWASARRPSARAESAAMSIPRSVESVGFPRETLRPSIVPLTPLPVTDSKPSADTRLSFLASAPDTMAAASGCSLPRSRLAARRRTSSSVNPGEATTDTTFGLPSVSVPVLSTTRVSTFSMVSSAAASLMRTPADAPRPTPTMIDMGVASPRAHGHAMISTATAFTRACASRGSGPKNAQARKVATESADDGGDEPPRDHVGEALDGRPAPLRLAHHLDDLGEQRVAAHALGPHHEAPGAVDGGARDRVAFLLLDGDRFAADHRLVDRARSFDDLAVRRESSRPAARAGDLRQSPARGARRPRFRPTRCDARFSGARPSSARIALPVRLRARSSRT